MVGKYILVDKEPLAVNETIFWASSFEHDDRVVAQNHFPGLNGPDWMVSTVFLGIDHNFGSHDRPILFETMIFPAAEYCVRYATWDEAEEGHQRALAMVPAIRRFDFMVETHAPTDHMSAMQPRQVFARTIDDALRVLTSEAFAFGLKAIHPVVDTPVKKAEDADL